jgi:hypothetical protein
MIFKEQHRNNACAAGTFLHFLQPQHGLGVALQKSARNPCATAIVALLRLETGKSSREGEQDD